MLRAGSLNRHSPGDYTRDETELPTTTYWSPNLRRKDVGGEDTVDVASIAAVVAQVADSSCSWFASESSKK